MQLTLIMLSALSCCALAACATTVGQEQNQPRAPGAASAQPGQPHQPLRIGIYDSRAVAVAYGRSNAFLARIDDLHQQHARAEAAGDEPLVKSLTRQGQMLQIRAHLQAFSNAPVNDILAQVQERLPGLAQRAGVVAIVASTDYHDRSSVEVVDLTDELVMLFNPDQRTQQIIADLKRHTPTPIEEIAQMEHKH